MLARSRGRPLPIAVVVSTWVGNPPAYLLRLLDSLSDHAAGLPYDVHLVANGTDYRPPDAAIGRLGEVLVRENEGYNLGAWDFAWRRLPGYSHFLFLQDDCYVKRGSWLRDFQRRWDDTPDCGIVGENLIRSWDRPWEELFVPAPRSRGRRKVDEEHARRARRYHALLEEWGIPPGESARHVTAVVHFTSRSVLEEVDGYPLEKEYERAVAAEIAFSKKVEACAKRLVQVGVSSHSRIGHREWPAGGFINRMRRSVAKRLG